MIKKTNDTQKNRMNDLEKKSKSKKRFNIV